MKGGKLPEASAQGMTNDRYRYDEITPVKKGSFR